MCRPELCQILENTVFNYVNHCRHLPKHVARLYWKHAHCGKSSHFDRKCWIFCISQKPAKPSSLFICIANLWEDTRSELSAVHVLYCIWGCIGLMPIAHYVFFMPLPCNCWLLPNSTRFYFRDLCRSPLTICRQVSEKISPTMFKKLVLCLVNEVWRRWLQPNQDLWKGPSMTIINLYDGKSALLQPNTLTCSPSLLQVGSLQPKYQGDNRHERILNFLAHINLCGL